MDPWPPPFGTAAASGLPPFDRDRSLRRTVVAQWLAHVPGGVPSAETVTTFAEQLARRIKGRSVHRYLASLRDVLEPLFPEADLGSALPRRLDRVFSSLPFNDWPEVARSDFSRAKGSVKPRIWQTAKEATAKYFALDPAPWPPTRESVRMFRTHLLVHRKAATARAYLTCLHTALARRARQGGLDLDGWGVSRPREAAGTTSSIRSLQPPYQGTADRALATRVAGRVAGSPTKGDRRSSGDDGTERKRPPALPGTDRR